VRLRPAGSLSRLSATSVMLRPTKPLVSDQIQLTVLWVEPPGVTRPRGALLSKSAFQHRRIALQHRRALLHCLNHQHRRLVCQGADRTMTCASRLRRLPTPVHSRAARSPPIGPILPIPAWWCRKAAFRRRAPISVDGKAASTAPTPRRRLRFASIIVVTAYDGLIDHGGKPMRRRRSLN
jgi:hypothetical protein